MAEERPNFCSRCGQAIVVRDAQFCKECGAAVAGASADEDAWNPASAFLLSVIPGLGHWYKGQRRRGVIWLITVSFFYGTAPALGAVLHLICGVNAAFGEVMPNSLRKRRRRYRGDRPRVRLAAPARH